jgi:hypothetical protein
MSRSHAAKAARTLTCPVFQDSETQNPSTLQMTERRDPAEMLHIQQDWLSGAFRRASQDVAMLNERIASMTQKATTDFEKAARTGHGAAPRGRRGGTPGRQ